MNEQPVRRVETDTLRIAYVEHGPADGWPVILSHGFPYDVHAFDEVAPILARAGARVIAPYTRGFGPNPLRFRCPHAKWAAGRPRSRHHPASRRSRSGTPDPRWFRLGRQCVLRGGSALAGAGYDIIDVSGQRHPDAPSLERVFWYQHLFSKRSADANA